MKLRVGQSLSSVVDATTVVVVRAPGAEVSVTAGGHELATQKPASLVAAAKPEAGAGLLMGKRYTAGDLDLELLCVRSGTFPVEVDGIALSQKDAKPLPASD